MESDRRLLVSRLPDFVEPMLARLSSLPTQQADWAFEVKWDGVRAIARSQPGELRLLSRNGRDITAAYPELGPLHRALGPHSVLLDGEIVAFDKLGRPSFSVLQSRMHVRDNAAVNRLMQSTPVALMLFDLLWLDGRDLTSLAYTERRALLESLELDAAPGHTPESHSGEGETLLAATREQGLEGIVAKRLNSRYTPGGRDGSWLKIKHTERQEFLIGGWTEGKGSRSGQIGALQVGVHEQGAVRYAGAVGTGFDTRERERLAGLFDPFANKSSPFIGTQPPQGTHFLKPQFVCEVEFTQWTQDGLLRHPSYKGLRDDKPAAFVRRELLTTPPEGSQASGAESSEIEGLIDEGREVVGGLEVEIERRVLRFTNLDKVLYPASGFTKRDLITYYASVAPALLPHLRNRPLTLKRYPNGVEGKFFYEKQCPKHRPDWVQTTTVWSESGKRDVDFCLCQNLPTLLWLANLADIEMHPSLSRAGAIACPGALAFDLDPGPPAGIVECCKVALELEEMFAELGMRSFAKTSGSKGLQVYVPLNDETVGYEQTKPFAHAVADLFHRRLPTLVISKIAKGARRGKVLIDWSQNDEHKTTVSVYSLRATRFPTVSTPLAWNEVRECSESGDRTLLEFRADAALNRVVESGDLFAQVISLQQPLPLIEV